MAGGKMQIKRIENAISRQVTFSKRRSGLFKKAKELSVLCDAEIAIILFSCNGKLYEWSSHNMKDTLAKYEKISGISSSQTYRREMLAEFGRVQGESQRVAAQIRCREGAEDFLDTLSLEQLLQMEEDTHGIVTEIRKSKKRQLDNRCEALRRKVAYLEQIRLRHIQQLEARNVYVERDLVEYYNNLTEGRSNVLTEISDYQENNSGNERMFQCYGYDLAVKANRNNAKAEEEEEGSSTITAAKFSPGFRR